MKITYVENNKNRDKQGRNEAIENRIKVLESALADSQYEHEKQNIRGAIAAYKSGKIGYQEDYTVIYAGEVVDTAKSYGAFVHDRQERLDRYEKKHGQHWLWWERGLKCLPHLAPRASKCLELRRDPGSTGLGQYWVNQIFWKRYGWVSRMYAASPSSLAKKE
jgi:hypothetical protein